MVYIEPRHLWGARYRDGDIALSGLATEVFGHHTVTAHLSPAATVEQERAQMRLIESIGFQRFGVGISYNVIVFPSGRAYQGVSWNRRGTHTGGRNASARSICFAGNYETSVPTAAAIETAADIYATGRGRWWTNTAPLRGHRDVKLTSCPGRHIYTRLDTIAARAVQLVSAGTPIGGVLPTLPGVTAPAPITPEEYVVATRDEVREDVTEIVRTEVERLRAELGRPLSAKRLAGTRAVYLEFPSYRRHATAADLTRWGLGITDVGVDDGFWWLPLVGRPGETYRKAGEPAVYTFEGGVLRHLTASQWADIGKVGFRDLPADHSLWSRPVRPA